jgi:hypothetical protein
MKTFLLLFCFFISASYACESKLLADSMDSKHFKLHGDDVLEYSGVTEIINETSSLRAANMVMKLVGCTEAIENPKITCVKAVRHIPALCYLEPKNLGGYFLVTKDYVDGVNVIFSRWD